MYKFYILVVFLLTNSASYAQDFSIPYQTIGGKMIIQVDLNGKLVPMIFDTGGQNMIDANLKSEWKLPVIKSREIKDANSQDRSMDIVQIDSISVPGTKVSFLTYPFLVTDQGFFNCFGGAKGLIGSDLLQACSITIDDKLKVIKVYRGGILQNNDRNCLAFSSTQSIPVIPMSMGKFKGIDVIFDTGCPYFLEIKKDAVAGLVANQAIKVAHHGKGGRTMGVHGVVDDLEKTSYLIPEAYLGRVKFNNILSNSSQAPLSLMGMEVLKFGSVTIDYVNRLFRFDALPNLEIEDKRNFWDVNLGVKDRKLVVVTVWDNANGDVQVDDEVTHIDDIAIGEVDFCESITKGIPQLNNKTKVVLTLSTARGTKYITINKTTTKL